MKLEHRARYEEWGLADEAVARLASFGDLLLRAPINVTAVKTPRDVEELHFLDSLAFLDISQVRRAGSVVDVGSGGGLPAVVLAVALPGASVTAVDSVRKKCAFVASVREALALDNLAVVCARAEDLGRSAQRETFDVAVARALAPLPVLAELTVPLVRPGGALVAAKGALSDQERMEGEAALGILGCDRVHEQRARSFEGAESRWMYVAVKDRPTPSQYPRRPGVPAKRPLGTSRGGGVRSAPAGAGEQLGPEADRELD